MWHIDLKFIADFYFWLKKWFGDDFGQYDKKPHYFMLLSGLMPLRNSIAMATPKVPGDKKLFKRVCYMLKLKATKFQLLHLTVSELY